MIYFIDFSKMKNSINLDRLENNKKIESKLLNDPFFIYRTGADVEKTWEKYGWKKPSENIIL